MPGGRTLWIEGMESIKFCLRKESRNHQIHFWPKGLWGEMRCGESGKYPSHATRHFGALSLEALETPSYLDGSSTGAMHKGCRPPGTPAV